MDILPTEIIAQIHLAAPTVSSALALSATCQRMYHVFHSKRVHILQHAAEAEYGPLSEIVQLLTQNASQPAHGRRSAPISDALLRQCDDVGRVAESWADIYPLRKWKNEFVADRRLLTSEERCTLRQAVYRLWLFDRAFHNSSHVRTSRLLPPIMHERAMLLHNFSNADLAAMLDVHLIMRDVIANHICPSNGKVRARIHKRFQHLTPSQISIHLNYPPSAGPFFGTASKYHAGVRSSLYPDPDLDGWGDDIGHYYVVEDMLKLDPGQILFLREHRMSKDQVQQHIADMGEWFVNNGEVFSETLGFVMKQRGLDLEELKELVQDATAGVVARSAK